MCANFRRAPPSSCLQEHDHSCLQYHDYSPLLRAPLGAAAPGLASTGGVPVPAPGSLNRGPGVDGPAVTGEQAVPVAPPPPAMPAVGPAPGVLVPEEDTRLGREAGADPSRKGDACCRTPLRLEGRTGVEDGDPRTEGRGLSGWD